MSKKIKENKVPLSAKEPDIKITIPKGKNEAVVTGVYKIRKGSLSDANTNTNTIVTTTKINEVKDTLNQALKINPFLSLFGQYKNFTPPYATGGTLLGGGLLNDSTETIKNVRTKFLQAKGKAERLRTLQRNTLRRIESTDRIRQELKWLMKSFNTNDLYEIAKNYSKSKLIRATIKPITYLEAGMWLKEFGLTTQEIVQYCFERMFATAPNRAKHLARKEQFGDINNLGKQPNWVLANQWAIHQTSNREIRTIHWKKKLDRGLKKYTIKMFHQSQYYKDWCKEFNIEPIKQYNRFSSFLKNSIKDYRRFCRKHNLPISPALRIGRF